MLTSTIERSGLAACAAISGHRDRVTVSNLGVMQAMQHRVPNSPSLSSRHNPGISLAFLTLITSSFLFPACSSNTPDTDLPTTPRPSPAPSPTTDTPVPITPTPTPTPLPPLVLSSQENPADPQSWTFDLTLLTPRALVLTCTQDDDPEERHRLTSPAQASHHMVLHGLRADAAYTCTAQIEDDPSRTSNPVAFSTAPLPPDLHLPVLSVPPDNVADIGYTLVNYAIMDDDSWTYTADRLVLLDALGNVRWYRDKGGGGDVEVTWAGNGLILFGGMANTYYTPALVNLDKAEVFIANATPLTPYDIAGTFHHDVGMSANGNTIFAMTKTRIDDTWRGFIVREIDIATNEVVWWWDAYADGVKAGWLEPGSESNVDPYHANSVQDRWEDGRCYVYLGLRNQNQVLKVDYQTKAVVWRLGYKGDFTLLEPDGTPAASDRWFFQQHDTKRNGDLFLVYDNGKTRSEVGGEDYTRVLVLRLNEQERTATIVLEYTEPGWFEPIWGGMDLLPNGHYLVARGHCPLCISTPNTSALIEIDAEAQVVWRLDYQNENEVFYRADRVDGCALFHNVAYCPDLDQTGR